MKYLGIDYGDKHVGIAVSNEDGTMAFPHATLSNNGELLDRLAEIVQEKGVQAVVIGESKNFSGEDNAIMAKARECAEDIKQHLHLPVYFEPEFLTSVEARHIQGGGEKTHASAAALILKSYLEREKVEKETESK